MNKLFILAVILCFVLFYYHLSRYADNALVYIQGINIIYRNTFKSKNFNWRTDLTVTVCGFKTWFQSEGCVFVVFSGVHVPEGEFINDDVN